MTFEETDIGGVWVIGPDRVEDERGFFARTWDRDEFADRGLNADVLQCSISFNRFRGTLRGLHYQAAPHEESKLVRCTAGAVFDVAVDLRPESSTFKSWVGVELSAANLHDREEVTPRVMVPSDRDVADSPYARVGRPGGRPTALGVLDDAL